MKINWALTTSTFLYKLYTVVKSKNYTSGMAGQILVNPDLILFVDGSYLKNDKGISYARHTVTTEYAAI